VSHLSNVPAYVTGLTQVNSDWSMAEKVLLSFVALLRPARNVINWYLFKALHEKAAYVKGPSYSFLQSFGIPCTKMKPRSLENVSL
jgi:hypothetical protein